MTTAPLTLLLGPEAPAVLATALDGYRGRLHALRVASVAVQPTGAAVVQYRADVERADGSRTAETLAATTGGRIPSGAAVLSGEHDGRPVEVGVWRWPQDPALPALAAATDPDRLRDALAAAGLPRTGPPRVRVRAYRPGRRAVLQVDGGGPRLYLKVVRPAAVDALVARHGLLAGPAPVPPVLAATADGLVVLPEQPGTPVRALLGGGAPLPSPADLDALLDALPPALAGLPSRPGHLGRVRHFTDVLALTAVTAPAEREALDALAAALEATDAGAPATVPVHGDLHDGQLLAADGSVTGLLDVDTAGPGHRVDEWATLLAHLSVRAPHERDPGPVRRYGATLLAHAEERVDRAALRPRIAAAVLGLATGPFRVQQPGWAAHTRARLGLAGRWLG
ncbi:phosphotransferase [Pseudonocardia humida]|uniref:phosphotransferase n=1 Tax=Pseudonocardia humida TaxID=2800819 RepID=UPI00207CAD90|nr:phosphotransferase [Pseudonocardia humida]